MRIIPTLTALAIAAVALSGCTPSTPAPVAPARDTSTTAPLTAPTATPTATPTAAATSTPSPVAAPAPASVPADNITAPQPTQPQVQTLTQTQPVVNSATDVRYYTPRYTVKQPVAASVPAPQPVKVQTPAPVVARPTQPKAVAPSAVPTHEQAAALCAKIARPQNSPYCASFDLNAARQDALATLATEWTRESKTHRVFTTDSVELRGTFEATYLGSDPVKVSAAPGTVVVKAATLKIWHTFKLTHDSNFPH